MNPLLTQSRAAAHDDEQQAKQSRRRDRHQGERQPHIDVRDAQESITEGVHHVQDGIRIRQALRPFG